MDPRLHLTGMNKFLTLVLLLTVAACQSKQKSDPIQDTTSPGMASMKAPAPEQGEPSGDELPLPESTENAPGRVAMNRQQIRNAQVRIRVDDFTKSGRAIEQAVQQMGGQVAASNEIKTDNSLENALTIRVPAARFDALLSLILKQSIFTDVKTITTEDVTRRYVDIEARIRSKKAVEETYLNLLKQARTVADVLKIEEQLGQIREEQEVQAAELRQLKDQVALSTLNLTYYQQTEAALRPEAPFYAQIWRNLADGFRLMGDVLVGLFYILPLGLVGIGLMWLVQRWRRHRRSAIK